jgi:hypothetical protein
MAFGSRRTTKVRNVMTPWHIQNNCAQALARRELVKVLAKNLGYLFLTGGGENKVYCKR